MPLQLIKTSAHASLHLLLLHCSLRSRKRPEREKATASLQAQLHSFLDFQVGLAVSNPAVLALGIVVQLDMLQLVEEQPPPEDHWKFCVSEMDLTEEQVGDAMAWGGGGGGSGGGCGGGDDDDVDDVDGC